ARRGRGGGVRRLAVRGLAALAVLATAGTAFPEPPPRDSAAAARRALEQDAAELRRLAEVADRAGLERTADGEWGRVLVLEPGDEAARKRLRYLRRGGEWVRDDASWAIVSSAAETHPDHAPAYVLRRRAEFERPSSMRHRDVALACR